MAAYFEFEHEQVMYMHSFFSRVDQISIGIALSVGVVMGVYYKGWTLFLVILAAVIAVNVIGRLLNARGGKFNWRYYIIPVVMMMVVAVGSFIMSIQEATARDYMTIKDNLEWSNIEVKNVVKAALSDGKLSHSEYLDLFKFMSDNNKSMVVKMDQTANLNEEREKLIKAIDAIN